MSDFHVGMRCEIVAVHHPAFNDDLGKIVVIRRLAGEQAWVSLDRPARTRINRNGREVIVADPASVQTVVALAELKPMK